MNEPEGILYALSFEDEGVILEEVYTGEKEVVSQTLGMDTTFWVRFSQSLKRVPKT